MKPGTKAMSTTTEVNVAADGARTDSIRVYNTLTRQKEVFAPVAPGRVGIYLCGPTVYKPAHIGHMVGPVIFDTIKNYLVYCGYDVTLVVNITDVDDKLIAQSRERGLPMLQIAEEMTRDYLANLQAFGVDGIDCMPKATEHIPQIIDFVQGLIDKGFAYETDGDVFFEVAKDRHYGKLSNRSADSQQGEGGGAASRKRAPGDFALWKRAKADEPSWDSPWGKGRPGWHIECSAMSHALLGKTFDIHGGGLDLVFPHHENEIAQSECRHGAPMVKYWMHNGLMRASAERGKMGGRTERGRDTQDATDAKISRSKGDGGLAELAQQHGGETLRFFLLRTHYRSTIVFGEEPLAEARKALETFYRFFDRYERITGDSFYGIEAARSRRDGDFQPGGLPVLAEIRRRRAAFLEKMDDDFNTGAAVSELFELVRALNKHVDEQDLEAAAENAAADGLRQGVRTLRELTNILGLFRQPQQGGGGRDDELVAKLMDLLIDVRATARQKKDFQTADKIRDELAAMGITLEDRKGGTGWRLGG
jgi:cysteinyl-tRNA synthetase